MMTTAVAVIALLPVFSSTGKGADIMVPMAIPVLEDDNSGDDNFCRSVVSGYVEGKSM